MREQQQDSEYTGNNDLYSVKFNEELLQNVYNYFNNVFGNPKPLIEQQQILQQALNNGLQRVIKMDCLRTRSTFFSQQIKNDLEIMLTHYCRVFDIKYKQGLNQIAAPFIYFRKLGVSIAKCQVLFHKFFSGYCLNFYDDDNFSSVELFVRMFSVVLKYHDPALVRYMEWHNIQPQLFCINWLMTLFSSKLSMELTYILWSFMAAQKDKFLLFFLVLAIVEINRQNIIQSKNINILQVVTNLIFKTEQILTVVIQRALLLRKNTPSSLILFFRDRMIFEKRQKFNDVAKLLEHMQKLNLFVILPGQMTLDRHFANGLCQKECYFCDLRKPLQTPSHIFNQNLSKSLDISTDIRTMDFHKQFVIMDVRVDQSKQIPHQGIIFKIGHKQKIQTIQQDFLSQFIQQKGRKHFVIVLSNFVFQDQYSSNKQQLQLCKKIINVLNSLSFPLISILEGGLNALIQQGQIKQPEAKKNESIIASQLMLCSFQLPYSFPLKISDRCRLASAFCSDQVSTFVGIVQILIIFDYFIFIIPLEKQLISFISYFEHNHAIMQYLYQQTHKPAELMVHKVISMRSLKKASMKVHNQNILVLLYDSCIHQEKRIFPKISQYLQMDSNNFMKLNQACKDCVKDKIKIVLQMNDNKTVKECTAVLTKKYMQLRKKIKIQDEN